jgi:hypothetical protein
MANAMGSVTWPAHYVVRVVFTTLACFRTYEEAVAWKMSHRDDSVRFSGHVAHEPSIEMPLSLLAAAVSK